MKISILNKWDVGGGAARAAYRLYKNLKESNNEIKYLVNQKALNFDPQIVQFDFENVNFCYLDGLLQKNLIDNNRTELSSTYFSNTFNFIDFKNKEEIKWADVINLHWVEKYVSQFGLLSLMQANKPIIWTLHDQRPLTGGCHYASGCDGFVNNYCKQCAQLKFDNTNLPFHSLTSKKDILQGGNVTIVTPSKWLADEARRSLIFKDNDIQVIPNSVETNIFKVINKKIAKRKLGINENSFCLMFGCHDLTERRKGFQLLKEAISILLNFEKFNGKVQKHEVVISIVGANKDLDLDLPIKTINFGGINDDEVLATIYSAADVFVLPSLEDNLPNTMLESMACGTPVIGFDIGGIPDVVIPDENGWLAEECSSVSLAMCILDALLNPEKTSAFSLSSSRLINSKFNAVNQRDAYLSLYAEKLSINGSFIYNNYLDKIKIFENYSSSIGYAKIKEFNLI